jgi:hypothetical protein
MDENQIERLRINSEELKDDSLISEIRRLIDME